MTAMFGTCAVALLIVFGMLTAVYFAEKNLREE